MTITLTGEPKSTQHIYRSACRGSFPSVYMTPEGKALKTSYQWQAKAQWRGKPLEGDIELWVTIYFGTKRKADIDNFSKLLFDSMTGIAYHDDNQISVLHIKRAYDKSNPRIEIEL